MDNALTLDAVKALPATPSTQRVSHIGPGVTLAVRAADRARLRELHRGQQMLVQQDQQGRLLRATSVQVAGALDDLYAAAESVTDLGATRRARQTRFALWAPTAKRVALCLYPRGDGKATSMLSMKRDANTGGWSAGVRKNLSGRYYAFVVDVFVRGRGLVRNLVTDPYSLSLTADSKRSYVADLNAAELKPAGWDSTPAPSRVAHAVDMVICELHVRDFSVQAADLRARESSVDGRRGG